MRGRGVGVLPIETTEGFREAEWFQRGQLFASDRGEGIVPGLRSARIQAGIRRTADAHLKVGATRSKFRTALRPLPSNVKMWDSIRTLKENRIASLRIRLSQMQAPHRQD